MSEDAGHKVLADATAKESNLASARRWAGMTLGVCGLAISGYLAWLTLTGRVAPGCGSGAGCNQVLSSRWSAIGPVPVSVLAAGGYVAILGLLVLQPLAAATRRVLLGVMGVVLLGAAAWYIALQALLIGAWCPYCLAGHGIGAVLGLVLLSALPLRRMTVPFGVGVPAVMLLMALQVLMPATKEYGIVVPSDKDYDLTDEAGRQLGVLGGLLKIDADDTPHTGPTEGESVVVLFLDYACPHCREAHEMIDEQRPNHPGLVVFALPLSLHETHNPHIPIDNERFGHSYELALLSMAVWRHAPNDWPEFDAWLFSGSESLDGEYMWPRTLAAAEQYAGELIGPERVASAYDDADLVAEYQRNLEALGHVLKMSPDAVPGLPIAIAPFASGAIYGRFDEADLLAAILEDAAARRP
ncbi:MAG: vitamin K epoxide reductase family protein [Phycisphaerales bacterium JB063]